MRRDLRRADAYLQLCVIDEKIMIARANHSWLYPNSFSHPYVYHGREN